MRRGVVAVVAVVNAIFVSPNRLVKRHPEVDDGGIHGRRDVTVTIAHFRKSQTRDFGARGARGV